MNYPFEVTAPVIVRRGADVHAPRFLTFKWCRTFVNGGMVNGRGLHFSPAAKSAIFRVFTRKNAIQKVR
jgi:hypothetical protein